MMKRLLAWLVVFSLLFSAMPTYSGAAEESEGDALSLREAVWQAALRTLHERGVAILTSSFEEGRILTEFTPLAQDQLLASALFPDQEHHRPWDGAEYRYAVGIGKKGEGLRVSIQAEIRAWTWESPAALDQPEKKQALSSNRSLEREFLNAFTTALQQGVAE
jgi:hypothetical protein